MITPSTPAATTRSRSAASSTVQASTATPRGVRRGDRAPGDEDVLEHQRRRARATRRAAARRAGPTARSDESPSLTTGRSAGRRETPNRSSGYVKPIRTAGACRATRVQARHVERRDDGPPLEHRTGGARRRARRGGSSASGRRGARPRAPRRRRTRAPRRASAARARRSRSSSSERDLTEPDAAPWLTSSSRSECARTSGPRGRSSTSNSIRSTPCSTAARSERSVFSGASMGRAAMTDAEDRARPGSRRSSITPSLRRAARSHHHASAAEQRPPARP